MKRVMLMMVLAALLLTQCRRPSIEFPTPSVTTTVNMTITAGPGSKTDISTMGGIVWSENDKIYVGDGSKYVGYLTIVSGVGNATGTFTGDVTAGTGDDCTFHFYYLGNAKDYSTDLASHNTSVEVDFSSQNIYEDNGKLKNASRQHVGYGKAEHVKVEADTPITGLHVSMKSKVAIAYFCFQKGEGESATPYTGALTLSGNDIYNKMTVKFNESDFSFSGTKGDISLANTMTHLKYAMLVPAGTSAATLTFGGDAEGSTALENGIEANKFYRIDGSMPIVVNVTAPAPTHEYVDLGLPSRLLWATCNLGAEHPYDYGDYYAWGATETWYSAGGQSGSPTWKDGYSDGYTWKHCPGNGGNSSYNASEIAAWNNSNLTNNVLKPEVDAAHANWGEPWCMPTEADFNELINNTNRSWTTESGVNGWKCANKSDAAKYIFLPAAGCREGTSLIYAGSTGYYWSSSLDASGANRGRRLYFYSKNVSMNYHDRFYGLTVRPVCPPQN